MKSLSVYIAEKLIEHGVINECSRDVYAYGLQAGFETLLNVITTLVIGILLGCPLESMVFLAGYSTLRTYAGGYHAESALSCYLISCVLVAASMLFCSRLSVAYYGLMVWVTVLAVVVITLLAPVPATHKPLDQAEYRCYRKRCIVRLGIEVCVFVLLFSMHLYRFAWSLAAVLILTGLLMLIGILKNLAQGIQRNRKW